jgi:hypothetical protein
VVWENFTKVAKSAKYGSICKKTSIIED